MLLTNGIDTVCSRASARSIDRTKAQLRTLIITIQWASARSIDRAKAQLRTLIITIQPDVI
ncbi:hypothetical protein [Dapis sp. BLCC M229]|uniref:hypothetical protein n=1 Tax=Dapis sp. BLCC M229 TaxID=3400188 RepID=UPI003CF887F1